jgi:hypothetical protein
MSDELLGGPVEKRDRTKTIDRNDTIRTQGNEVFQVILFTNPSQSVFFGAVARHFDPFQRVQRLLLCYKKTVHRGQGKTRLGVLDHKGSNGNGPVTESGWGQFQVDQDRLAFRCALPGL